MPALFRYDAANHHLNRLSVRSPEGLRGLLRNARDVLPEGNGALVILVGDDAKVTAAYHRPQSLIWRDAGALLQTLNLTATAFGQAFCAMGVLGDAALEAIARPAEVSARGMAMIGMAPAA